MTTAIPKEPILLEQVISMHDVRQDRQENFYHGLMLGTMVFLDPKIYLVKSNRESGYDRFDLMLIPRQPNKTAAILEFKAVQREGKLDDNVLEEQAKQALIQIDNKAYDAELKQTGIKTEDILKVGIGFSGKQFRVATNIDKEP